MPETPPRVLHVVDMWRPVPSGYVTRTAGILEHQAASGIARPSLLVSSRQFAFGPDAAEGCESGPVTQVPPSATERRVRRLRRWHVDARHLARRVARAARDADIVHVHGASALGRGAAVGARAAGRPLVAELRYDLAGAMLSETFGRGAAPVEAALRARFWSYLADADAVVCASEALATLVRPRTPLPVAVVPNGVDGAAFGAVPIRRRAQGAPLRVGSTAHALAYEGLGDLVRACAGLDGVEVVLAGEGPRTDALRALAKDLRAPVRFEARRPYARVPDLLAGFDVFAIPRLDRTVTRHASPIKLVEAMAAGRAVVSTDVGDMGGLLADGRGLAVPPGDRDALRAAIVRMRDDEDARLAMGGAARAHVLTARRWMRTIEGYRAVYADALRARASTPAATSGSTQAMRA